jgi:hypothetical protein
MVLEAARFDFAQEIVGLPWVFKHAVARWFGLDDGPVSGSPEQTKGTMVEPERLAWGEAYLWCLDLKMVQGCVGGDMVRLGLGAKWWWAQRLSYPIKERWHAVGGRSRYMILTGVELSWCTGSREVRLSAVVHGRRTRRCRSGRATTTATF